MGFPESSTHFRHWQFASPDELASLRSAGRQGVTEEEQLSPEQERLCVEFCGEGLLNICREKKLSYAITSSAIAFYARFFLKRSVMVFDPRKILFTCIVLSAKSQDPSLPLKMKSLLSGVNGGVSIRDICELEIPLLDALGFQLLVLDTRTPLQSLCNEWFKQTRIGKAPAEVQQVSEDFGRLTHEAEQLCLQLYVTDLPFLFTPTQVALAVFLHVFKSYVEDEESFFRIVFRNNLNILPAVREKVHAATTILVEWVYRDKPAKEASATKALKAMDKMHRRRRRKRLAEESDSPPPKKQKIDNVKESDVMNT